MIFVIPLTETFPNPLLLTHPNVPKPMHGLSPRTVMGTPWWDQQRHAAYDRFGQRCWACGVHRSRALIHRWLEGHEVYRIDYAAGRMNMTEIVALCPMCHSFIHSGRLKALVDSGQTDKFDALDILHTGLDLLEAAHLQPFLGTRLVIAQLEESPEGPAILAQIVKQSAGTADWSDWRLVIDGKTFEPLYKTYAEWADFYGSEEDYAQARI